MSRDKQIEEMARDIALNMQILPNPKEHPSHQMARLLFEDGYRKASDVVNEIIEEIEKQLARYSHLHRYAEEARQVTEEFADGTPCEMTSVWDVLPLHKNGWDDYETMNKLQENIEVIEKSRLLKEFEGDIAELKKKHESEGEG